MAKLTTSFLALILAGTTLLAQTGSVFRQLNGQVFGGGGVAAPVFVAAGTPCDESGGGSCVVTQSISSGHLIVAYVIAGSGTYTSYSVTDSNSDSFSSCTKLTDAGGGRQGQLFYAIAGAAITTITLNVVAPTGGDRYLLTFDYTNPAGLATGTILDQCLPGAQNEGVTSWTTGASSATTNSTDLVTAFFWTNTGTYTVGGGFTARGSANCCSSSNMVEDITTSTTGAQTGTATLGVSGFGPGVGAAFK